MKQKEAYQMGYDDGLEHAKYCTLSEADYRQLEREDKLGEVFGEIVDGYRQFSPFEFTAKAFNDARNGAMLWEAYDLGEWEGWVAGLSQRFPKQQYRVTALHGGGFSVLHPQGGTLGIYKTRKEAEEAAAKQQ
jgi:hypothetical protein